MKRYSIAAAILFFLMPLPANALDKLTRDAVCPDAKFKDFGRVKDSCIETFPACMEGYGFSLPADVFTVDGVYRLEYTDGLSWSYKCLIQKSAKQLDYGCRSVGFDRSVHIADMGDVVAVQINYPSYHLRYDGEHDKKVANDFFVNSLNRYPEATEVKVFRDEEVLYEKKISFSYSTQRIYETGCYQQVCCYGQGQ